MNSKFQWYWYRLIAMSPKEILVRGRLAVKKKEWHRRTFWEAPSHSGVWKDVWDFPSLAPEAAKEQEILLHEADAYLDGAYTLLNIFFNESDIRWHFDPQLQKHCPLEFGLDLNYRDSDVAGNVKNIWEKNRHHHLTVLALAYALTGNQAYAEATEREILSWIDQNPFPLGVNWASSLELGIRLISWIWIERCLRSTTFHQRLFGKSGELWPVIYWHQWLIAQHYSHGSSANNHLVGEMAGLFITSSLWPVFPESAKWQDLAREILEREVSRQTFPCGLNREQAFSYHIFSLEFFLLAGLEAERLRVPFSLSYQDWVRRMLEVIPQFVDVGGNLPRYGDGDEGMALQLRPLRSSRLDWLFRLGRQWLNAQVPLPQAGSGSLAAAWVGLGTEDEVGIAQFCQGSVGFEDAGLFVLASNRGQPEEVFCLADAGALGFLSIAAHGHADSLSFTLSVGGVPVLVDPGTYSYHADPQVRAYFRGTKAHNTVVVDALDQSEPAGTFLWIKKARSHILNWEATSTGGTLVASHDGYRRRLSKGITHQRQLTLEDKHLFIKDELKGRGVHDIEWRQHFSPLCTVSIDDSLCLVNWAVGSMKIHLDPQLQWSVVKGVQDAGWFSAGFNLKEPTCTLIGAIRTQVPISLVNYLEITL